MTGVKRTPTGTSSGPTPPINKKPAAGKFEKSTRTTNNQPPQVARPTSLPTGDGPSPLAAAFVRKTQKTGQKEALSAIVSGDRAAIDRAVIAFCQTPRKATDLGKVLAATDRVATALEAYARA